MEEGKRKAGSEVNDDGFSKANKKKMGRKKERRRRERGEASAEKDDEMKVRILLLGDNRAQESIQAPPQPIIPTAKRNTKKMSGTRSRSLVTPSLSLSLSSL